MTCVPVKARSELVEPYDPRAARPGAPPVAAPGAGAGGGVGGVGRAASCGVVPGAKPAGLGRLSTRSMPKFATAASVMPAFSPTRGSLGSWGLLYTVGFAGPATICANEAVQVKR